MRNGFPGEKTGELYTEGLNISSLCCWAKSLSHHHLGGVILHRIGPRKIPSVYKTQQLSEKVVTCKKTNYIWNWQGTIKPKYLLHPGCELSSACGMGRPEEQTSLTAHATENWRQSNTAEGGSWFTFTSASTPPWNITHFCATSSMLHACTALSLPQRFQQMWVSLGLEAKFNKTNCFQGVLLFLARRRSFMIIKHRLCCCLYCHCSYCSFNIST